MHHPASALVYAACGADVRTVLVAGRVVVRDRNVLTVDVNLRYGRRRPHRRRHAGQGDHMNARSSETAGSSCDLLLTGGRIVDVVSGTVREGDVAVAGGRFVEPTGRPARRVVDLKGRVVAPGFIDAHVHVESSMVSVGEFARAVVAHGTTAVVTDPHEIANVLGAAGHPLHVLEASAGQPLSLFCTLPSCVPATELETSGARLAAADLEPFFDHPRVVALGEVMNFPGVLNGDPGVLAKIAAARRHGKPVDGHAPGLAGAALAAYVAAGITSDHECTTRGRGAREARGRDATS